MIHCSSSVENNFSVPEYMLDVPCQVEVRKTTVERPTHLSIHHQQVPSCRVGVLGGEFAGQELARVHVQDELCALTTVPVGEEGGEVDRRHGLRNSNSGEVSHRSRENKVKTKTGRWFVFVRVLCNGKNAMSHASTEVLDIHTGAKVVKIWLLEGGGDNLPRRWRVWSSCIYTYVQKLLRWRTPRAHLQQLSPLCMASLHLLGGPLRPGYYSSRLLPVRKSKVDT